MEQIATFHTHLGALRFERKLRSAGDDSALMTPVPRKLSASCGTCVRFEAPFSPEWTNEDLDAVYVREGEGYAAIYKQEE